jgi:glycosyltransferase involved in cell wall biosynthesis
VSGALSLFFPMYNEERNIETAVQTAVEVLAKRGEEFEVIVVDDGSADRTGLIADRLAAADPRVHAVHHPTNLGYGAALRSGFAAARYPLIFFTDGDNQFDLRELPGVIAALGGADIVCGYRIARRDPWYRKLNAALYNGLARLLFRIPVRDVNCAFKLYRREAIAGLPLASTGALINVELLARARKRGAVLREVGVHHYPRTAGTQTGAKLGVILRAFTEIVRLWRDLR